MSWLLGHSGLAVAPVNLLRSVSPELCALERYQVARRVGLIEDRARRLAGKHHEQSGAD